MGYYKRSRIQTIGGSYNNCSRENNFMTSYFAAKSSRYQPRVRCGKMFLITIFQLLLVGCETPNSPSPSSPPSVPNSTIRSTENSISAMPSLAAPLPPTVSLRVAIEGCKIVAEDGQILGLITSNSFDADSFLSEYGRYGSKYSSTSIWNEYGKYGGQYSALSPFNQYSTTPPRIVSTEGIAVGFLTVNPYKSPGISPFVLASIMK